MRLKPHVGLLITPTAIEAARCSQGEGGAVGFDFYHRATLATPLVDEEGEILDAPALGVALAAFWEQNRIRDRHVVLGLSGSRAIARMVSLPRIPANQLEQVVLSEAEQYTQFRDAEPRVDYFTVEADEDTTTVFYAATTQQLVDAYAQALKAARLNLKAVDLVQFAALRDLAHARSEREAGWDGVVVMPGRLVITRWSVASLQTWREVTLPPALAADEDQLNQFIETEVSRTCQVEGGRDLLVSGPSLADSARLATYFSAHTDLPLRAAGLDDWTRRVPTDAFATISPAVLGLALWGLEPRVPSLDPSHRAASARDMLGPLRDLADRMAHDRGAALGGFAALGGLVATLLGSFWYGQVQLQGQNEVLRREIAALQAANSLAAARVARLEQELGVNTLVLQVIGEQARPNLTINFLDELADLMPPDAFVEELQAETPEHLLLLGRSASQGAGLWLAQKISTYREVARVTVLDLLRSDDGTYNFRLRVALQVPPPEPSPAPSTAPSTTPQEGAPSR
ncbi:MAG: pilus assembly protein PilM [Candidatus Sericytochromatia bacterium]|nr:pilus assembly protein PilM [Candidatus Sericytochromatia bacterium]